jgi:hypothetical protein
VSGQRGSTSERRLTQNQITDAAVKIIGNGIARRADVQAIVEKMSKMFERGKRARSRESKSQKQFAKQYGLALRKVIVMTNNAPTDFRAPSPLPVSVPQLGIDKEWFDHERLLRHLKLLHLICEGWERSKLKKPRPDAYEKRLAAEAALHLLKLHKIDPTTQTRSQRRSPTQAAQTTGGTLQGRAKAFASPHATYPREPHGISHPISRSCESGHSPQDAGILDQVQRGWT